MQQVPENIFSTDLLCFLSPNKFSTEEDKQATILLHKICIARLTDFHDSALIDDLQITDEEKDIVIANQWNESANCEIKARCLDILKRFVKKDKRQITANASDCYLDVYSKSEEVEYLVRAVTVRSIKMLNDDVFFQQIKGHINEKIHPFWLNKLIVALLKSYTTEQLSDLVPSINKWRNATIDAKDFQKERGYIEVLSNLKRIDKTEYHKQIAISFENEADETANNRQQNTYYPNLPDIYQSSYKEIFQIRDIEPNIFNRIKEKLLKEQKIFIEMLSECGVKSKMEVPEDFMRQIDEQTRDLSIKHLWDAIALLLSIPFPMADDIIKYMEICMKVSPMSSLFGRSQLNSKGNIVGTANCEVALKTEAHIYFRQSRQYALWSYSNLIKWSDIYLDSKLIYAFLQKNKPVFIEEDNLILWERGITAGFNKDFITASYILMPQLEHALHNIAEMHKGSITSLEAKRQEEPALRKILVMLRGIIEQETLFEIESFLQSGIDVNFRNSLLHGLLVPFEIDKYGIYLWWLCLKIYLCKDIYTKDKQQSK